MSLKSQDHLPPPDNLPLPASPRQARVGRNTNYLLTFLQLNAAAPPEAGRDMATESTDSSSPYEPTQKQPQQHHQQPQPWHFAQTKFSRFISLGTSVVCSLMLARFLVVILNSLWKEHLLPRLQQLSAHSQPSSTLLLLKSLFEFLEVLCPNPIAYIDVPYTYLYLFLIVILFHFMIYHRMVLTKEPMDILVARLLTDYSNELVRIDCTIRKFVRLIRNRFIYLHRNLLEHNQQPSAPVVYEHRFQSNFDNLSARQLLARIDQILEHPSPFRPPAYSLEWHRTMENIHMLFLLFRVFLSIPFILFSCVFLLIWSKVTQCSLPAWQPCTWHGLVSWIEVYSTGELFLSIYTCDILLTYFGQLYVVTIGAHYKAIEKNHHLMNSLFSLLKQSNEHDDDHELAYHKHQRKFGLDEVDLRLLDVIVGVSVAQIENKRSVTLSSFLIRTILLILACSMLIALIAIISNSSIRFMSRIVFLGMWMVINIFILSCGYLHAAGLRLTRLAWSIQAELVHRKVERGKSMAGADFIELTWRRLTEKQDLSNIRYAVNLFGLGLSYETLIQFNFYLFSFAVWMISRR